MKPRILIVALLLLTACKHQAPATTVADPKLAEAERMRNGIREMITSARDKVFPALVNIHVVTVYHSGGMEQKGRAVGSGTIISPDGYVVTNQHVTDEGQKFTVTLSDRQEVGADLVGEDPLTDLALIKIRAKELRDPAMPLPFASFGDSDKLQVGDYVMSMGSPFALSRSVTLGIVSNNERVFSTSLSRTDGEDMELGHGQRTGMFTRWIQHDALINPGNSGGPLVNLQGQVVGVNELGGSGLGYAIPSNLAKEVVDALREHGEVPRSWTGMAFKPIDKTGIQQGVLVNSVVKDSPADKAGIKPGDVVTKVGDRDVTVKFAEQVPPLLNYIADQPIGSTVNVSYLRDGAAASATVTTAKQTKDRGEQSSLRGWGMTVGEITDRLVREARLDRSDGVMVTSLRSGGAAATAEPPISGGDILRKINGKTVTDLAGAVELYQKIMEHAQPEEKLVVEFERRGENMLTLLKPKPEKEEDPPRELAKAWVGIATQVQLRELAEKTGHPDAAGFRITRVYPKTKAADSGLEVGDVIVGLNGENVVPRGLQEAGALNLRMKRLTIGENAKLTVLRGDKKLDIPVTLEKTRVTQNEARHDTNRDFDLSVREVTFFDRDEERWDDDVQGVIVTAAEPAGWAGLAGIVPGDLIQKIDGESITDLQKYRDVMVKISQKQPERVVFQVLRGARTGFQYAEPQWKPAVPATQPAATRPAP